MGLVEGQNVAIESRYTQSDVSRLPDLAADLVRRQVAVIATLGGAASMRAVRATSTTLPIVFEIGGEPVQTGLVASLNRKGGNATGVYGSRVFHTVRPGGFHNAPGRAHSGKTSARDHVLRKAFFRADTPSHRFGV
jgi:hypothetical protein